MKSCRHRRLIWEERYTTEIARFAVSTEYFLLQGTKVRRQAYNWHSAGSLGWPFSVLKYQYIFQMKYTEANLSNSPRKLSWFEIIKMLIIMQFKQKNIYYNIIIL